MKKYFKADGNRHVIEAGRTTYDTESFLQEYRAVAIFSLHGGAVKPTHKNIIYVAPQRTYDEVIEGVLNKIFKDRWEYTND